MQKNRTRQYEKSGYPCLYECALDTGVKGLVKKTAKTIRFIYQRAKYGYCDKDVWEMQTWFLRVVPGMLKELRNQHRDYPAALKEVSDAAFVCSEEADEKAFEKWNEILDEMISLFENAQEKRIDMTTGEMFPETADYRDECKRKGLLLLDKWFWDLWW